MFKNNNVTQQKTYAFAIRIVNLYRYMCKEQYEYILSKQLLRSGTAVGAIVSEGVHAQSRADFLNKMNVALKEAQESEFWIRLLHDTDYLTDEMFESIHEDCVEIVKLLTSIVKTLKDSMGK
ncbi:MAG: four helix bundle protein [Bacteroidaceae bacterium]|nr:four helix bundle protein [Bacteroidaceae bacterium]